MKLVITPIVPRHHLFEQLPPVGYANDLGGAHWEGETEYDSIDDALVDLETGIEQRLQEIYGE